MGCASAFAPIPNTKRRSMLLCMSKSDGSSSRAEFLSKTLASSFIYAIPTAAQAFDGGVGGLGKTRPVTGVVFRDPEAISSSSNGDDVTNELLAPDGTEAFVTFQAPWVSLLQHIL